MVNAKNGISSYEIARALGVTQKTARFMNHRIRTATKHGTLDTLDESDSPSTQAGTIRVVAFALEQAQQLHDQP